MSEINNNPKNTKEKDLHQISQYSSLSSESDSLIQGFLTWGEQPPRGASVISKGDVSPWGKNAGISLIIFVILLTLSVPVLFPAKYKFFF